MLTTRLHKQVCCCAGMIAALPYQQDRESHGPAEADLAAALAQEATKAQRRGRADPFADMDLRFKEVRVWHEALLCVSVMTVCDDWL